MDIMDIIVILLRWMHILGAAILVGGVILLRWGVSPVLSTRGQPESNQLNEDIRSRWSKLVMLATLLLLVSGIVNVILMVKTGELAQVPVPYYHILLTIKMALALVLFGLLSVLAGRSSAAQRMQANMSRWLTISVILAVIIVGIAGVMKLTERHGQENEKEARIAEPETADAAQAVGRSQAPAGRSG